MNIVQYRFEFVCNVAEIFANSTPKCWIHFLLRGAEPRIDLGTALQQHNALPLGYVFVLWEACCLLSICDVLYEASCHLSTFM